MLWQIIRHAQPRHPLVPMIVSFGFKLRQVLKRCRIKVGFAGPFIGPVIKLGSANSTVASFDTLCRGSRGYKAGPNKTIVRNAKKTGHRRRRRTTAAFAMTMPRPKHRSRRLPSDRSAGASSAQARHFRSLSNQTRPYLKNSYASSTRPVVLSWDRRPSMQEE